MNEIHWKRGIPTEEECRECHLIDGSIYQEPKSTRHVDSPGDCEPKEFREDGWYAAVRILPPEQKPAEDPEEWVTQDQCNFRAGVDEHRWNFGEGRHGPWQTSHIFPKRHGFVDAVGNRLEIRCRRKDLPPLPKPVIREFRNTEQQPEGPQPGQWWQSKTGDEPVRVYVCGFSSSGNLVVQWSGEGHLSEWANMSGMHHLPDCTGWDWQPNPKTKTQRKWVTEQWITDGESPNPDIADGYLWESTDDVREVPL